MEQEAAKQGKDFTKHEWGPTELLWVLCKGLEAFKQANKLVPVQGALDNQMLALRPTREGGLCLLEDCTEESTQQLLSTPGLKRSPPGRGIAVAWAEQRNIAFRALPFDSDKGTRVPPVPDWDDLAGTLTHQDDMPKAPEDERGAVWVEFDMGRQDLALSDEQKAMLLPVEARLAALSRPVFLQERFRKEARRKRKNKWCQKFKGIASGKGKRKWAARLESAGKEAGLKALRSEAGPVAKARAAPKPKGRHKSLAKAAAKA